MAMTMRHTRAALAQQSADAMNHSGKAAHAILRTVLLVAALGLQGLAQLPLLLDRYIANERKREEQLTVAALTD